MPARQTTKKAVYRIRNWREYNQALVRRGSLTIGVDQEALGAWNYRGPTQWGAQYVYSDAAIPCLLTLRAVFHRPLRATQGMAASIFELMGLDLEVPPYSTLSRRAAELSVDLARKSRGPLHLVLDINPAMKKIKESQSSGSFRRDGSRSGREAIPGGVA